MAESLTRSRSSAAAARTRLELFRERARTLRTGVLRLDKLLPVGKRKVLSLHLLVPSGLKEKRSKLTCLTLSAPPGLPPLDILEVGSVKSDQMVHDGISCIPVALTQGDSCTHPIDGQPVCDSISCHGDSVPDVPGSLNGQSSQSLEDIVADVAVPACRDSDHAAAPSSLRAVGFRWDLCPEHFTKLSHIWADLARLSSSFPRPLFLGAVRACPRLQYRSILAAASCFGLGVDGTCLHDEASRFAQAMTIPLSYARRYDFFTALADPDCGSFWTEKLFTELAHDVRRLARWLVRPGRVPRSGSFLSASTRNVTSVPGAPSSVLRRISGNSVQSHVGVGTSINSMHFFELLAASDDLLRLLHHPSVQSEGVRGGCGRCRNVFPLPALGSNGLAPVSATEVDMVNLAVLALNQMHGTPGFGRGLSRVHSRIHDILLRKFNYLRQHLGDATIEDPTRALDVLLGRSLPGEPETRPCLRADDVDLISPSRRVNAVACLPQEQRDVVNDIAKMFPGGTEHIRGFRGVDPRDVVEYARLVALQLLAGTVDLAFSVRSGGTIFPVAKRDSTKVREVWHGEKVSTAACVPPPPPHLLSPSAMLLLEASVDRPLRLCKRDGRCLFDQLGLPAVLKDFMGRPPIRVAALLKTGLLDRRTLAELAPAARGFTDSSLHFPRSRVWPMGFSWSSYVAQCTMQTACHRAGLTQGMQLADDLPGPLIGTAFGLATDDICIFVREDFDICRSICSRVDRSLSSHGIVRHEGKDITGSLNGTAVGVDLVDGLYLLANCQKLIALLPALFGAISAKSMTPLEMSTLLGGVQWLHLLNRPLFISATLMHSLG